MEQKSLWIFLIAILFLAEFRYEKNRSKSTFFRIKKVPELVKRKHLELEKLSAKENRYIFTAASSGYKIGREKELKEKWKTLGILHLLTPSGIHLATILMLFRFLGRFKKVSEYLLISFLFLVGGFFSIERIFLIKQFKLNSIFLRYIFGILLSLLLGHYQASPLSFIYSFLFLGIFYSGSKKLLTKLTIAHLVICWFNETPFYLFAPILNFCLTSIFSLAFPIILISYWLPFSLVHKGGLLIIDYFNSLVDFSYPYLIKTIELSPSWPLLIILFCVLLRKKRGVIALLFI